jgi:extradiol dioxygenase family protein
MTPAAGSLGFSLFQHAYVVRDLDAAIATFGDHYGVSQFTILPMPAMEGGASMRIALAWSAGQMIELIEAKGPGLGIYTDWLADGSAIRLHHFGYLIEDDEQWAAVEKRLEAEGKPPVFAGDGGICQFIYVHAPELGHYLEYVYPNAEGRELFEKVAAN